jgi:DNA-binding MarR family transcriptional regulator
MNPEASIRDVLWQLAFQFKASTKQAIGHYGLPLTGMHVRLLRLIRAERNCTANSLASMTRRDKAQITRVLKELTAMGLIERTPHPSDKRSQLLSLSEQGRALMKRALRAEDDVKATLLRGLDDQEVETFLALANKMLANLRHRDEP